MVMHALKSSDNSYLGFGEAYFSTVNQGETKGWKQHKGMTSNLIVPHGLVRFVVHDGVLVKGCTEITPLIDEVLGIDNYFRLTVPPGFWLAFHGVGSGINIVLNVADKEHSAEDSINYDLDSFTVKGCIFHG